MVLTADFLLVAFGGLETSSFLHPQSIVRGVPACSIGKKYIYKTALASPPEQVQLQTQLRIVGSHMYLTEQEHLINLKTSSGFSFAIFVPLGESQHKNKGYRRHVQLDELF